MSIITANIHLEKESKNIMLKIVYNRIWDNSYRVYIGVRKWGEYQERNDAIYEIMQIALFAMQNGYKIKFGKM